MTPEDEMYDLEDYSSDPNPHTDEHGEQNIHDQLPSVAEAKLNTSSGGGSGSLMSKKFLYAASAIVVLLVVIIAVSVGGGKGNSMNVEEALNRIAINPEEDFVEGTYQYRAKRWLLEDEKVKKYSFDQLRQRYAMHCLYHATSPESWYQNKGWKRKSVNECKWFGVMCDEQDRVTRIELRNNGLKGEIPEEIKLLDSLEVLTLNANEMLHGKMPFCGHKHPHNLVMKADCEKVTCDCCDNCKAHAKSSVFD